MQYKKVQVVVINHYKMITGIVCEECWDRANNDDTVKITSDKVVELSNVNLCHYCYSPLNN